MSTATNGKSKKSTKPEPTNFLVENPALPRLPDIGELASENVQIVTADSEIQVTSVTVPELQIRYAQFTLVGIEPYMQNKFSEKARQQIMDTQAAGSQAKARKVREPKDFEQNFRNALHIAKPTPNDPGGWAGIPSASFRCAMVSACRIGSCYKMTHAKLAVHVVGHGYSADQTSLVRIHYGQPRRHDGFVRNDSGVCDIRSRPIWEPGWRANVTVRYFESMLNLLDVTRLLSAAGQAVGIGEGRPDSKNSAGMGLGLFRLATAEELEMGWGISHQNPVIFDDIQVSNIKLAGQDESEE